MKNIKSFILGLVLGLSITVAGIAYAQTNTQSNSNKKAECCCMSRDGGSGGSCDMMKEGAMKEGAEKSDGHGCCCCSGDSCEMNHAKHKDAKSKP